MVKNTGTSSRRPRFNPETQQQFITICNSSLRGSSAPSLPSMGNLRKWYTNIIQDKQLNTLHFFLHYFLSFNLILKKSDVSLIFSFLHVTCFSFSIFFLRVVKDKFSIFYCFDVIVFAL